MLRWNRPFTIILLLISFLPLLPANENIFISTRHMPQYYTPCTTDTITINIWAPEPSEVHAFAVDEKPPDSWIIKKSISSKGTWDPIFKKIKWGYFSVNSLTSGTRELKYDIQYKIRPPENFSSPVTFSGRASYDGIIVNTIGENRMEPSGITPSILIDHILGVSKLQDDKRRAGDFNNDSQIDISDFILLIKALNTCEK